MKVMVWETEYNYNDVYNRMDKEVLKQMKNNGVDDSDPQRFVENYLFMHFVMMGKAFEM